MRERNLLTSRFELQRKDQKLGDMKKHAPQPPTYTCIMLPRVQVKGGGECSQGRGEALKDQRTGVRVELRSLPNMQGIKRCLGNSVRLPAHSESMAAWVPHPALE